LKLAATALKEASHAYEFTPTAYTYAAYVACLHLDAKLTEIAKPPATSAA
jgi:hypothetical protein